MKNVTLLTILTFLLFSSMTFRKPSINKGNSETSGNQTVSIIPIISADAMNILYIGFDNPISIVVVGFENKDIVASIENGSLIKVDKGWIAKVLRPGKTTITVSVRMKDGSTRKAGSQTYRIKDIPLIEAKLGALGSGYYSIDSLYSQNSIQTTISNFPFEGVRFVVKSYTASFISSAGNQEVISVTGPEINQQFKALLAKSSSGDKIVVDEIEIENTKGGTLKVAPIVIRLL